MILERDKDPMGAAIADYYRQGKAARLRVFSSQFEEDELPVRQLFRRLPQMPVLEQKALQLAEGYILDVGAGSGCHSLELQQMGKQVTAIDISPLAVDVMLRRGVHDAQAVDLFDEQFTGRFDTLLLLMNGSGIIGRLQRLPLFFTRVRHLLNQGGKILMDSSDLRYLYEEEDGSLTLNLAGDYYGEVDFRMQYKQIRGDTFDWLYIDFQTLSLYATQCGFRARKLHEGIHYDYLAELTLA